MSDLGYNVYGVIAGTLGLLAILPLTWLITHFPSRQMRILESLLKDTEDLFRKGLEDGLLTRETELHQFHSGIWAINLRIDDIRPVVSSLRSSWAEFKAWWGGLSRMILRLQGDVGELRAKIVASSSRDRKELAAQGYASALARLSGARTQERRASVFMHAIPPVPRHSCPAPFIRRDSATLTPFDEECYPAMPRTDSPSRIPYDGSDDGDGDGDGDDTDLPPSRSPYRPPTPLCDNGGRLDISDADLPYLPGAVLVASQARTRDKHRERHSARQDMLRRFSRQLSTSSMSHRYPRDRPSTQRGYSRNRSKTLSELLPTHRHVDDACMQGGGVVQPGVPPLSARYNLACNEAYDGDDESDA